MTQRNRMKFAKTIDNFGFPLAPLATRSFSLFCAAIWCQAAHRTRSHSSGNPTHSKDDLQQRRKLKALSKAQRLPSLVHLPLSLSRCISLSPPVRPPIFKSISLLAVQLFERLRPILADKTATLRKKRKVF